MLRGPWIKLMVAQIIYTISGPRSHFKAQEQYILGPGHWTSSLVDQEPSGRSPGSPEYHIARRIIPKRKLLSFFGGVSSKWCSGGQDLLLKDIQSRGWWFNAMVLGWPGPLCQCRGLPGLPLVIFGEAVMYCCVHMLLERSITLSNYVSIIWVFLDCYYHLF